MLLTHAPVAELTFSSLPQFFVNGVLNGAIYALIALGYTLVYGVLRLITFAHGEVYMLGAYAALLTSYALGYGPGQSGPGFPSILTLAIMLLVSMSFCALLGVLIERFAYRPMRSQPRIASLITAIGVSLLFQFGGQLVLPVSPPPSISERVNPDFLRTPVEITLKAPDRQMVATATSLKPAYEAAKQAWEEQKKHEANEFDLSPEGKTLRTSFQDAERAYQDAA